MIQCSQVSLRAYGAQQYVTLICSDVKDLCRMAALSVWLLPDLDVMHIAEDRHINNA